MTATPTSIATQLSTMERRPYFLAPSTSPECRTVLDYSVRRGRRSRIQQSIRMQKIK